MNNNNNIKNINVTFFYEFLLTFLKLHLDYIIYNCLYIIYIDDVYCLFMGCKKSKSLNSLA